MIKRILLCIMNLVFFMVGCTVSKGEKINYKEEMKTLVKEISEYSKSRKEEFIVVIQNAEEVIYNAEGNIDYDFLEHIDGIGKESLFFGYEGDDEKTEDEVTNYSKEL